MHTVPPVQDGYILTFRVALAKAKASHSATPKETPPVFRPCVMPYNYTSRICQKVQSLTVTTWLAIKQTLQIAAGHAIQDFAEEYLAQVMWKLVNN